jgi:hypothetical protein
MGGSEQGSGARKRGGRWTSLLFLLLPGGIVFGMLAPDLVHVAPAEESEWASPGQPVFRPPPLYKEPLLIPRNFSTGTAAALVDLEHLFSRTSFVPTPSAGQLSRMVAFPQNTGEMIALDEVSEQLKETSFKDVLAAAVVPRSPLPGPATYLALGNPIPRSDGLRYDDFPGPNGADEFTTVVPEPGSALLLALGLFGVAGGRRRHAV